MSKRRKRSLDIGAFDAPFGAFDNVFDNLDGKLNDLMGDADVTLDETMKRLDRKMRDLDMKLNAQKDKKYAHKMTFKHNGATVKVRFNDADDISIHTTGDLDYDLEKIIKKRIREDGGVPTDKPPTKVDIALNDLRRMAGRALQRGVPLLSARDWKGGRGKPLEFTAASDVAVSVGGMFGRKYTVEVDGTTVYMVKNEEMMEHCWVRGDLGLLVASWTDDEKAIMRQVIHLLCKSHIAERHHEEVGKLISL